MTDLRPEEAPGEVGSLTTDIDRQFDVETRADGGAVVVAVSGELDLASSPALDEELERAAASSEVVILDLRKLEFMDSTGVSVLVKAQRRAQQAGGRFIVVRGTSQVQRLLDLTGVDERLSLVDSPDAFLGDGHGA